MYESVDPKVDFPKQEEEILEFWEKNDVFKKSIENREDCEDFVFFDGPPFATGLPHFGHFVPCTVKDVIPRYKTMKGMKVERRFGWDCHGLPVENLIEKELGFNSKTDIDKFGVANFNDACRASVLRYTKEWETTINRLGRWVDFKNDYKTMENDYMESIWNVFKQLWDKGLIYEGNYILPYCPRCSTVLSTHELNLGGYKQDNDPAITVRFKVKFALKGSAFETLLKKENISLENLYCLAWTTTPWTLPSNLGLAVGADIDYSLVQYKGDLYFLAENRIPSYFETEKKDKHCDCGCSDFMKSDIVTILKCKGKDLDGLCYEPLFPYFLHLSVKEDGTSNDAGRGAFRLLLADFVSTEDGTGIVHLAPGFGEDDNKAFKDSGVPTVCPIDAECKFTNEVSDYEGLFVKSADKQIIDRLKNEDKLFKRDQITHSYPHCWRCDSPLIYRAVGSWFVAVEKFRDKMIAANKQINWQPAHIKEGRFGKWVEGARDWAISRNRYWGNPIPIWVCESCGKQHCVGSREELEKLSGKKIHDLHKQFVDEITIPCECGGTMKRVPEVLDCWFESGSMPYAQVHYPFENKEHFEKHFPSDFIAEGIDQTRGWFYVLLVLSTALFDRPPFKNCIVNGLVLANDGRKMSKSLKNYTDPVEVINNFGADALRLFLLNSQVVKAEDLKFSDEGVRDVLKNILIPFWNSYSFFVTYANIDNFESKSEMSLEDFKALTNPLDLWILSMAEKLILSVTKSLDEYNLPNAIEPLVAFIDLLNNWYIRRSRRRFWKSDNDNDKLNAYKTLYSVIKKFILVAAPIIPFITESIWQNLRVKTDTISVHLSDYPVYNVAFRNEELEFKMETVQKAISMGRALRNQYNLKTRQPLKSVEIVTRNEAEKNVLLEMKDSVMDELNVKDVIFHNREDELVSYSAKPNFRILGKELGASMKKAAKIIEALESDAIQSIVEGATLSCEVDGKTFSLNAETLVINRHEKENFKVVNEGTLTVALNTEINEELLFEGYARDLIRGIQNLRKDSGFDVVDRIALQVWAETSDTNSDLQKAFKEHKSEIMEETLALKADWCKEKPKGTTNIASVETDEKIWGIAVCKLS
ncbi:MAG: isoleucine--tRNA ligase [Treponemataceae bacterium]